ncbi:transglutaminase-like domain-containing protein [Streptomyces sp. CA-278952]|uniref:transglutaminase-like domain-containing protein n=1 Tax=unclassified Streptomyces TaxID=2593676 RepID=UPI002241EE99|nr:MULTISPECIES: transglutaminase-like domain-containing protein [unclassified Streptomyces]UZI28920.1 transglutaminase-like domain-containing protein [Streptomyces sp. VB1]WDG28871.1 transglutaminase-like domain-containing protein [Streptomyces sp. CA-278952]
MSALDSGTAERRRQFAEEARSERPDLALLCLLLGAEAGPVGPAEVRPVTAGEAVPDPYGIDAAQIELDRLAGLLPYGSRSPAAWASALAGLLGGRCGFGGSSVDYQRLDSSLLQQVLRRRRGLPILLSVVWIEVARRAGAPVYGVALPGHFVVGFGDREHPVLADPFAGGAPLTGQDAELLVTGATGAALEPSMMTPARPLEIVLRILNNVRAWAAARPERTDVALWAVELSLLLPSHPARLRFERAQLLVQRGEFLRGAAEMEEYAKILDGIEPTTAENIRRKAHAARALLN